MIKFMVKYTRSRDIREMQIETTMLYHHTL